MKLRFAALLACGFCLGIAATGQQQPFAPPPNIKGPCPADPGSKTAWFDPNIYLLYGSGIEPARAVSTPAPDYSESARQAKINGVVLLAVAINAGGTVDAVKVACKLEPGLDQNAAAAVKQWRFTSATKDSEPVPVQIEVAVGFRLY